MILPGDALRIMVVDDSALYRQLLQNVLRDVPGVEVVGMAKTGQEVLDQIDGLSPDLLTLDVQMPGLSGIDVLRELKNRRCRTKAVMVSSFTAEGAQVTTNALMEGAFDFILKPAGPSTAANRQALHEALCEKIQIYRESQTGRAARRASPATVRRQPSAPTTIAQRTKAYHAIVVGTSTGGPAALREVLNVYMAARRGEPHQTGSTLPRACCQWLVRRPDARAMIA